jgi:Ca2+-binding RTX toxin-like protein
MNAMSTKRAGRRALALSALAGALFAALLGFSAEPAFAAYNAKIKGGTLTISGDGASDKLVLRLQSGSPSILEVDVGADGTANFSFDRSKFTAIDVQAGRGDDEVRVDQSAGSFPDEAMTINGGAGADVLRGGSGAETFVGGTENDVVSGGDGNDRALLGDGDDRFEWIPGDDNDVVEGQRGTDLLDFNGNGANESIDVSANGGRVRFFRNVANVVADLAGVERISFDAFGGTDTVVVNDLTGTAAKTVDIDLRAVGGGPDAQIDTVLARGTAGADIATVGGSDGWIVFGGLAAQTRIAGGEAQDELTLATLGGQDTISVAIGIPGPAPVNVDGGEGADVVRYNGTPGPDTVPVIANGTEVSVAEAASARIDTTGVESLVVLGHAGADTISGTGNLASLAELTFDGGEDGDVLLGGNGADLLVGGGGNDVLDGNQGSDRALAGDGDDRFQWDPGDGNDAVVDGQVGTDLLDFFGSGAAEQIGLSSNGALARLTRDIAAISLDLAAIEHVAVHALGNTDAIDVGNLSGTAVGTVDADLAAFGGGGDGQIDNVLVRGTEAVDSVSVGSSAGSAAFNGLAAQVRVAGGEAHDEVTLATLGGEDTISPAIGIPGPAPINVDGGEGADVVRYNGTAGADTIPVVANGAEVSVAEATSARVDTTAVENLVVLGHAGTDTISGTGNLAALIALTFEGGDDNDQLSGGNGADVLVGGGGNDGLDGNQGTDQVLAGDGDDRFQWDPGDGNDTTVDGQAGNDLLDFFGSGIGENIALAANGQLARLTRNVATISIDLAAIEHVAVHALGGTDTIDVGNLAGTAVGTVDADLGAFDGSGDAQVDNVLVRGTDAADSPSIAGSAGMVAVAGLAAQVRVAGGEAQDELTIATFGGADTISAGIGIPGPAPVNVDGGDAADIVQYNGTAAGDQLDVVANGAEVSTLGAGASRVDTTAVESLVVLGHGGADTISGTGNLAALTALTFEGGEDGDVLRGGNGADVLVGGNGNDAIDGNQGADQALMGDGEDRFQWDPGDGNDVVDGQAGTDLLDFFGSNIGENIAIAANGQLVRLTRNIALITMDLDNVEHLAVHAVGGTDNLEVGNLAGTDVGTVDVGLGAIGGTGDGFADTVVVNGTDAADLVEVTRSGSEVLVDGLAALVRIAGGEAANDTLRIQTLDGDDDVIVAPDVNDAITPIVDLGAGE